MAEARGKPFPTTDPPQKYPDHGCKVGNTYEVVLRGETIPLRLQFMGVWDEFLCFHEDKTIREFHNSKPEPVKITRRFYKYHVQSIDDAPPANVFEVI